MAVSELSGFYRGDDHALRLVVKEAVSGDPVDVSGWLFISTLKLSSEMPDQPELDDDGLRQVMTTQTLAPVDEVSLVGECTLVFGHDQTRELIPTTYQMDIQRTFQDSVITVFRGTIPVLADVTYESGLSKDPEVPQ